jgi:hypothetical protein
MIVVTKHLNNNTKWIEILLYYDFVDGVANEKEDVFK